MVNKIYVTGPVGSGKSTLARRISMECGFMYVELDNIVHEYNDESRFGNRRRPAAERDALFASALGNERWIMEDTGRKCFEEAMQHADSIILLEPPVRVRKIRILLRWLKQRLGLEKSVYIPNIAMLKLMYKWTRDYENGTDELKVRLEKYADKVTIIRTKNDADSLLKPDLIKDDFHV